MVGAASNLHPSARRQRRARTLSPPPPRTVEQPSQACSITRSFIAAPLQTTISAGAWLRQQALSCRVQTTATSTHLESASTSHRGAPSQACSINRSFMAAPLRTTIIAGFFFCFWWHLFQLSFHRSRTFTCGCLHDGDFVVVTYVVLGPCGCPNRVAGRSLGFRLP